MSPDISRHRPAYTTLRVEERGVVLYEQHLARLAEAGPTASAAFRDFALQATPGCYSIQSTAQGLDIKPRPPSALFEGMPVRWLISPHAGTPAPFAKPAPPSAYDPVRAHGVATLLTSADGAEIYESCVAAVIAWDGARLLAPPDDRPAVRSTALAALRDAGLITFRPIAAHADEPLALVNALAGICLPSIPGRAPFPAHVHDSIAAAIRATARRP